jgi:hypothetical protein
MADFTSSGWPSGATVNAHVAPTVPGVTALGSSVASGTASSSGTVTFTGLTANVEYIATDGTTRKRFAIRSGSDSGTGLPAGGADGDVLVKQSASDGDADWEAPGVASVTDGSITAAKISDTLKPSVSAGAATEALRALGTSASTAAAGNDSRLSDARNPTGSAGGVLAGTYPNPSFASDMATQAELDAHAADTTSVHGIADTTALATTTALTAHADDTAGVHGIQDTSALVARNVFSGTSWPTRPTALTVLWIGGGAGDDPTADMDDGDIWFPSEA